MKCGLEDILLVSRHRENRTLLRKAYLFITKRSIFSLFGGRFCDPGVLPRYTMRSELNVHLLYEYAGILEFVTKKLI